VTTPVSTPNSYNIASETITLETPANDGYNFAGWSGSDLNGSYNSPVTIPTGSTGDRTYVAHWSKHVITFDANGGYGIMPDQALITGTLDACAFAKKGYTFAGWVDQDNTPYTNGQSITDLSKDLTLKAKWTKNS
jgi:uncharacterized repeat protein (TIGR02543 family)